MSEPQNWHRLFGLSWADFFYGLPVNVEVEKDLSLKQQYLDVVIVRLGSEPLTIPLPDGFDVLGPHNLISFKSFQETLDGWALNELLGHYVNYRKQVSPTMRDLLPETDFRLFMVCARFPHNLADQVSLVEVRAGVYDVRHFGGTIRLIVVGQLPCEEPNAVLCLFSGRDDQRSYGAKTYHPRSLEGSSFLLQLFKGHPKELLSMPYTLADLARDTLAELLPNATVEDLKAVPVEKRLESVPMAQRIESVPMAQRIESVPMAQRIESVPMAQRLEGVSADELVKGLSPEALQALRKLLATQTPES